LIDKEAKGRQSTWLDFANKATKQKGQGLIKKKQESIFKSPDTVMGKVGVVGSGREMTKVDSARVKYHEKFNVPAKPLPGSMP